MERRVPAEDQISPKANRINLRIGNSFSNSVNRISDKVDLDMEKFKNRISPRACDTSTNESTGIITARSSFYSPKNSKNIRKHKSFAVD